MKQRYKSGCKIRIWMTVLDYLALPKPLHEATTCVAVGIGSKKGFLWYELPRTPASKGLWVNMILRQIPRRYFGGRKRAV